MIQSKYWEIIADNLSKAGWSWACVSGMDSRGQTIWIADAHRGDGKRFVVRADEKLTAFVELKLMASVHGIALTRCEIFPHSVSLRADPHFERLVEEAKKAINGPSTLFQPNPANTWHGN